MSDFLTDGESVLPGVKADLRPATVPPAQSEWSATDANQIRQALLDLRSAWSGAQVVNLNLGSVTSTGTTAARTLADRFAEEVSVLDYGADPTGVTDATLAFNTAVASGRTVFVPKGTYKILTTIILGGPAYAPHLRLGAGVTLWKPSTAGNTEPIVRIQAASATLEGAGNSSFVWSECASPRGVVNFGPPSMAVLSNINFSAVRNVCVRGVKDYYNVGIGLDVSLTAGGSCYNNTVSNVEILDVGTGIRCGPIANGNIFSNLIFYRIHEYPIDFDGSASPSGITENSILGAFTHYSAGIKALLRLKSCGGIMAFGMSGEPGPVPASLFVDIDSLSTGNIIMGYGNTGSAWSDAGTYNTIFDAGLTKLQRTYSPFSVLNYGASTGITLDDGVIAGLPGIWFGHPTAGTRTMANAAMWSDSTNTHINAPTSSGSTYFRVNNTAVGRFDQYGRLNVNTVMPYTAGYPLIHNGASPNVGNAVNHRFCNDTSYTNLTAEVLGVYYDGGTNKCLGITGWGRIVPGSAFYTNDTSRSATPTINNCYGAFIVPAGSSTVTVGNDQTFADSLVICMLQTNDTTMTGVKSVAPTTGGFVFTGNAACTADVKVAFMVFGGHIPGGCVYDWIGATDSVECNVYRATGPQVDNARASDSAEGGKGAGQFLSDAAIALDTLVPLKFGPGELTQSLLDTVVSSDITDRTTNPTAAGRDLYDATLARDILGVAVL